MSRRVTRRRFRRRSLRRTGIYLLVVLLAALGSMTVVTGSPDGGHQVSAEHRLGGPADPSLYRIDNATIVDMSSTEQLTIVMSRLDGSGIEVSSITTKVVAPHASDLALGLDDGRCYLHPLSDVRTERPCPAGEDGAVA